MDLSIGQYDTYTTLQLAQYVSTIANGGYRIAPKVLKEIREPSEDGEILGPLIQETEVKILNRIKNTDAEIDQVKRGMHYVYYGANGDGNEISLLEKTMMELGKREQPKHLVLGISTINLSHVGFAPYENPEIAYAVIIPNISTNQHIYPYAQNEIVKQAVDEYFKLKAKRAKEETSTAAKQPIIQAPEIELQIKK